MSAPGHESLWLGEAAPPVFPQAMGELTVDVVVIGGGISGLTTALLCKRDGARVAVLERGTVAGGASGFTTAKISALQGTKLSEIARFHGSEGTAAYAQAALEAIDWIEATTRDCAIDCGFERISDATYAADASQAESVARTEQAARSAGLPVRAAGELPLPYAVESAVVLERQAQFDPVRYLRGLAELIPGDDCHVFERSPVEHVDEGPPCTVTTDVGARITAGAVVVCTNYPLLDRGLFFARMEATRSYLVAGRLRGDGELPGTMAISAGEPTRSVRPYVDPDGQPWVLVGGEGHVVGSEQATPERYGALERFAREQFDVIDVPYRWSTQDGMPLDRLPYAGRYHPRASRLYVNCGHQKWGMTNGTAGARVVADLIAERGSPYAELLDPNRVTVRSAPQLARAQLWVGAHLVGDRLSPAEASSAEEVPAGEARVVRSGLGKVGVHRDDAGELHTVSLRCTHLGCLVHWNGAERSWDCPCHGSRFGIDGEVLAGPATKPLERREAPG